MHSIELHVLLHLRRFLNKEPHVTMQLLAYGQLNLCYANKISDNFQLSYV